MRNALRIMYIGTQGLAPLYFLLFGLFCLFPVQRALNGPLPTSIELIALISTHLRLKGTINSPMFGKFLRSAPEAYSQTSKVSSTESSRFRNLRSLYRDAQNISLELHEQ